MWRAGRRNENDVPRATRETRGKGRPKQDSIGDVKDHSNHCPYIINAGKSRDPDPHGRLVQHVHKELKRIELWQTRLMENRWRIEISKGVRTHIVESGVKARAPRRARSRRGAGAVMRLPNVNACMKELHGAQQGRQTYGSVPAIHVTT